MDAATRIELALTVAVTRAEAPGCPPRLGAALRHAVFPRGARVRPRLCLAVAAACGDDDPAVTDAAAAAIECCTAPPWSTTTCPASTTPRPGAASRRSTAPSASRWPCWPATP